MDEAQKLISYIENLRRTVRKRKVPSVMVFIGLNEAMIKGKLFKKTVRKIRFSDIVPEDSVRGGRRLFLYLGYMRRKRRLIRCNRALRCSLKRSVRFFEQNKPRRAYKWLGRAISYGEAGLKVLSKIDIRISTALNTAKTVQIQIQKRTGKM
jgi:hypothetical protein